MSSLPSYEDARAICNSNISFKLKHQMLNGADVVQITYFLASVSDFFDAHQDDSMTSGIELRGITFVKESDSWERYLFVNKFFNINQTNGSDSTYISLNINGKKHIVNINYLFMDENDKIINAINLKVGMSVTHYNKENPFDENNTFIKINTLSSEILPAENKQNSWMYDDVKHLKISRIANKEDGSAIRFVPINGKLYAKTKFSFESEQAEMANQVINGDDNLKQFIMKTLDMGLAALFEIVSPFNKIVLSYNITELKLLQLRDEETGEYLNIFNHPLVKEYNVTTTNQESLETLEMVASKYTKDEMVTKLGDKKFTSLADFLDFLK